MADWAVPLAAGATESSGGSTGEQVVFWVMAPLAVLGALGLVLSRKVVHGALSLAVTMISLAVFYLVLEAPFLGVVQVVVYTGAIMMLFLFVIMLVGVDASDSRVETIRGQRAAAVLAVLGVVVLLTAVTGRATLPDPAGMEQAAPDGNVPAIADLIFGTYVWAFEVIAALLITAAVGAMALTHREQIFARPTQREQAERRFREGRPEDAAGLPVPGVYARHNAVDTPALLPDGTPSEASISRVLVARGAARSVDEFSLSGPAGTDAPDETSGDDAEAGDDASEAGDDTAKGGRG
ncbi:NADH-quinone oxidoreductase subunit J [Haloactinopolyspora alba]